MLCKSCNEELKLREEFCGNCGSKINRSCYVFSVSESKSQEAMSYIQNWLNQHNYKAVQDNGESYFKESWCSMCMSYFYDNGDIIIYAWKRAMNGNDVSIEEAPKSPNYMAALSQLFDQISLLSNDASAVSQNIRQEAVDKQKKDFGKNCNIALIISIIELLLSIMGVTWAILIVIFCFLIAIAGIKNKQHTGKSVAILVLNIISILFLLMYL